VIFFRFSSFTRKPQTLIRGAESGDRCPSAAFRGTLRANDTELLAELNSAVQSGVWLANMPGCADVAHNLNHQAARSFMTGWLGLRMIRAMRKHLSASQPQPEPTVHWSAANEVHARAILSCGVRTLPTCSRGVAADELLYCCSLPPPLPAPGVQNWCTQLLSSALHTQCNTAASRQMETMSPGRRQTQCLV
jgi:hypothetical protein